MTSKLLGSSVRFHTIRKFQYPACVNCAFFIKPIHNSHENLHYGKCKKFGEMDLVTGFIDYDYATLCREDTKKCGWRGTEYQILSSN